MFRVIFLPGEQSFSGSEPISVSEAAASMDLLLEHPCGARGTCGKCRVRFLEGTPPVQRVERSLLSRTEREQGWRLACRARVDRDARLEVPRASLAVSPKSFGPELLEGERRKQPIRPKAGHSALGLAVDLGSTTLAAALVDLDSTRVLASGSALNPQFRHGGDVLSRIEYARQGPACAERMQALLRSAVGSLCRKLCRRERVPEHSIVTAVLCGNASMSHFLAGADVRPLGQAPYQGSFVDARALDAREIRLPVHPEARVELLPQIQSHIGGDTVAALLATGLPGASHPALLVDLGTNTELVLAAPPRLLAASAAAGPAFEGAGIRCGMRATDGAIDRVSIDGERIRVRVRGAGPARGMSGTGLVDAVAALLDLGIVGASGHMRQTPFVLASGEETQREQVELEAADVRQLQLVKGSIRAGLELLLERAGLSPGDLERVLVAGAFGSHLRKESALRIGLFPEIDPERIRAVGNAAGIGARMALCDQAAWELAGAVARRVEHVELATEPGYTDAFAEAMAFPSSGL